MGLQGIGLQQLKYPSGRDFLKELAVACKKAGLGLFIYYSVGLDWHHPYYLPNTMYDPARPHYAKAPEEYKYAKPEDFKHYMNFAKTQIMELCTMYGPIAGFWFDTVGGVYQYSDLFNIQEVYDMIHTIQPHALVVFKTGANGNEDFITGERSFDSLAPMFKSAGLPKSVQDAAEYSWQSNKTKPAELNIPIQTLGWAYHSSPNQRQKSAKEVMDLLEYCAKVNANLLLNIGPRPDGTIPEEQKLILDEVGAWVNLNSEAIYGSRPWKVYGDNLNSIVQALENNKNPSETDLETLRKMKGEKEQFNERTINSPLYGHDEVRFTTKEDILYIFVLNPKKGPIRLSTLGLHSKYNSRKIKMVQMIGGSGALKFTQDADALLLHVPSQRPNSQAVVFKTVFEKN